MSTRGAAGGSFDGVAGEATRDAAWRRAKAMVDEYSSLAPYSNRIPERRAEVAAIWAEGLATICPAEGRVSCAPETFAPILADWGIVLALDMRLEVVAEDRTKVRAALDAATDRILRIDTDGHEWTWAELDEAPMADENGPMAGGQVYTPNYVSGLVETDDAVGLWIDDKGVPYPEMARADLRVVLEELDRAGVTDARIRPLTRTKPSA